jgi:hypothetical protein
MRKDMVGTIDPLDRKLDGELMHGIQLGIQLLHGVNRLILKHLFISGVDGAQIDGTQQKARDHTADQRHCSAYKYILPKNTVGLFGFQEKTHPP